MRKNGGQPLLAISGKLDRVAELGQGLGEEACRLLVILNA